MSSSADGVSAVGRCVGLGDAPVSLRRRGAGCFLGALALVLDLLPDAVELDVDHALGHQEIMLPGELVEEVALQLLTREIAVVALDLLADGLAQFVERFEPQRGGKRLVDRLDGQRAHRLDRDRELDRLAGEIGAAVIGRKGEVDGAGFAGAGADERGLEAGEEAAGAELQRMVRRLRARHRVALGRASEIHHGDVALGGGAFDRLLLALALRQTLDRLVDLVVGHLGLQPLDRQLAEIHRLDLGQHLDRDLVFEVVALVEIDDLDLGLQRGPQIALAHRGRGTVVHGLLEHFAHDRFAVALA